MTEPTTAKAARSDKGKTHARRRDGAPFSIMRTLAETGPMEREELEATMTVSRSGRSMALSKLRADGLIAFRVVLTPKGLEELRRAGWRPDLDGLAAEERGAADVTAESAS